jgi:farnesyl-diphosphate farnesyltransferase
VIQDITAKMGAGMADFAALATPEQPVAEVNSLADYDLYCHYVAGLVGEGLSGLFASSGKEREWIADQLTLSNSMGMLLQKTNIFRDIKEDVDEGRGFWPRAIWGKHGFNSMAELLDPAREREALFASSEMVLDALRHAVDALDYMTLLKTQSVFNFVAIPAVMAIATLERCFMNPDILKKNVKIRRGEAIRVSLSPVNRIAPAYSWQLINRAVNPRDVSYIFREYAKKIHAKVARDDPNLLKLSIAVGKVSPCLPPCLTSLIFRSNNGQSTTTPLSSKSPPPATSPLQPSTAKVSTPEPSYSPRWALISKLVPRPYDEKPSSRIYGLGVLSRSRPRRRRKLRGLGWKQRRTPLSRGSWLSVLFWVFWPSWLVWEVVLRMLSGSTATRWGMGQRLGQGKGIRLVRVAKLQVTDALAPIILCIHYEQIYPI